MQITRENSDHLNAIVKISIDKSDYSDKVSKVLKNVQKTTSIPGFRKGHVPMGMIKRQYEQSIVADEVNKLIEQSLFDYLRSEKIDYLGGPIPKQQADFSWNNEEHTFEFLLGLMPDFEINFDSPEPIKAYKIVADEEMINNQVKQFQVQYGRLETRSEIKDNFTVVAKFHYSPEEIEKENSFQLDDISEENKALLQNAKIGDTVEVPAKNLFSNKNKLARLLEITTEKVETLDGSIQLEVIEINEYVPHALNEDLFSKFSTEEDPITTEEDLRAFIKKGIERQLKQYSEQHLFDRFTDYLIDSTNFELPVEFLQKWLQISEEEEITEEEAQKKFQDSEKSIRFELIQNKLIKDFSIQVSKEEVEATLRNNIEMQMQQYRAYGAFTDEMLDNFVQESLTNKEQVNKTVEQIKTQKIFDVLKEKLSVEEKEVNHKTFTEEAYS